MKKLSNPLQTGRNIESHIFDQSKASEKKDMTFESISDNYLTPSVASGSSNGSSNPVYEIGLEMT
jgi:hypothetical protein